MLGNIVDGHLVEDGYVVVSDIHQHLAQAGRHGDRHLNVESLLSVVARLGRAIQRSPIHRYSIYRDVERLIQGLEVVLDIADFISGKFKQSDRLAGAVERTRPVVSRAHVAANELAART